MLFCTPSLQRLFQGTATTRTINSTPTPITYRVEVFPGDRLRLARDPTPEIETETQAVAVPKETPGLALANPGGSFLLSYGVLFTRRLRLRHQTS